LNVIADKMIDELSFSEKICKKCIKCNSLNSNECVEWNCPNLYDRSKSAQAINFLKKKQKKLIEAVTQL
jgi:hypothetical protein